MSWLFSILNTIFNDLAGIKAQQRWLLVLFKDVNATRVDDCAARLAGAIQKFEVCNGTRHCSKVSKS